MRQRTGAGCYVIYKSKSQASARVIGHTVNRWTVLRRTLSHGIRRLDQRRSWGRDDVRAEPIDQPMYGIVAIDANNTIVYIAITRFADRAAWSALAVE
jgi:hypothetical protein